MSNGKRSLSIKQKFIAALVVSGGIVAIMIGGVSYYVARDTAIGEVQSSLVYPLSQRATLLDTYEQSVRSDMFFMTHVRDVGRSIGQFSKSFAATEEASGQGTVAKAFVEDNPHPADRRSLLDKPAAAGKYGTAHSLVHPMIRAFLEARGYYDVFLIAPDGLINYSVAKEADFGTNLVSGPYAASGLGRAFASASKLKEGEAVFVDFEGYAPSNGAPAAFVATPIYASAGFGKPKKFQGVLAFQVPAEHLERAIMTEAENSPIQTFLLGSDNLVRTNVAGVPGEEAMKSQFSIADNYVNGTMITSTGLDGEPALVASQPVTFFGIPWRIVSQQSTKTAMAGITTLRNEMLTAGLPILLLLSAMAWYLGRSLARPILAIDSRLATMTEGDIETPVPGQDRGDEIGSMARNAEAFRHKIAESEAARQAQVERDSQIEQEREAMMADLEAGVGAVVTAVTRGELNTRVDRQFADAAINGLGQGVNKICDVVGRFLTDMDTTVNRLSNGDLTASIEGQYDGRFGEVSIALNETIASLSELVGEIKQTGGKMDVAIREVATGSSDLAERAESQAASLEETAATMEEISSTVNLNAESAEKATVLAGETQEKAAQGRTVVSDAVSAMGEIEGSSQKITDIITVIDSIAFQTNLLALNAAVEAARAGDAGKGFAVVASEVRTLAQRSAGAAKDIKDLITVSTAKVSDGVRLVNATGDSLSEIMDAITHFSKTISGITEASKEQSIGVAEISNSISHMDEMTQQNSGLADASASSAKSLTGMADHLIEMIEKFKTNDVSLSDNTSANGREFTKKTPSQSNMGSQASPHNLTGDRPATSPERQAAGGDKIDANGNSKREEQADREWNDLVNSGPVGANTNEADDEKLDAASGDEWREF